MAASASFPIPTILLPDFIFQISLLHLQGLPSCSAKAERKKTAVMEGHGNTWFRGPIIGKGAFGSVYKATAKKPFSAGGFHPRVMAVKSAEVSVSASLQKEKEVLTNLSQCRNVLRCFGEETTIGDDGRMVYNVLLEYAPGGTLASLIKNSSEITGLPESEVRLYTKFLVGGIRQVHDCGYVHCDLKPQNILFVPSNKTTATTSKFLPKIADFGLAKRARQSKRKFDPYLRGTAMYLAPETVVDRVQEPPSDIWALGCLVLEMLTGKPPWDLKPDSEVRDLLHLIRDPCQLPKIPTKISKEAREFLKGCLVRNPKFRLTAEMLSDHPFLSCKGDNLGEVQEGKEFSEAEGVSTSSSSFESSDASDSFLLSHSDSGSLSSSWSEDVAEFESYSEDVTGRDRKRKRTSNFIVITDADNLINKKKTASLKTMHKCTIPNIPEIDKKTTATWETMHKCTVPTTPAGL